MLDSLKTKIDLPVNFKPKIQEDKQKAGQRNAKVVKNEEYYLEHCPVEIVSILLKFIIELLAESEIVNCVEEIPYQISRLLYLANSKSELLTEKDIFDNYLHDSKKLISKVIKNLTEQGETIDQMMLLQSDAKLISSITEVHQKTEKPTKISKSKKTSARKQQIPGLKSFE